MIPYRLPLNGPADVIISGQMFEHCPQFWELMSDMAMKLRRGGYIFLIAPSTGPEHRYPRDCYRFLPDGFAALAEYTGLSLIECRLLDVPPWRDLTGVFRKGTSVMRPGRHCCPWLLQTLASRMNPRSPSNT